jgi:hypothetical protein
MKNARANPVGRSQCVEYNEPEKKCDLISIFLKYQITFMHYLNTNDLD